ncbi:hypothetical protein ACN28S_26525 [Cystobacter fuscus]
MYIADNEALTTLSGLRNVTSVGDQLLLYGNAQLTSAEGPASLTSVASYIQVLYSGFTNFRLPSLRSAWVIIIGRSGQGNEQLKSIQFPRLGRATSLGLDSNPVLDTLELPAVRLITDSVYIYFSPALPRCRVNALLKGLSASPLEVDLYELDESTVCQ